MVNTHEIVGSTGLDNSHTRRMHHSHCGAVLRGCRTTISWVEVRAGALGNRRTRRAGVQSSASCQCFRVSVPWGDRGPKANSGYEPPWPLSGPANIRQSVHRTQLEADSGAGLRVGLVVAACQCVPPSERLPLASRYQYRRSIRVVGMPAATGRHGYRNSAHWQVRLGTRKDWRPAGGVTP